MKLARRIAVLIVGDVMRRAEMQGWTESVPPPVRRWWAANVDAAD